MRNVFYIDNNKNLLVKILYFIGNEPEPPRVSFSPQYLTVHEGEPIEIRCVATGNPSPTLQWSGGQNNRLNPEVSNSFL